MKKVLYIILLAIGLISCEDVIEVDLTSEPPRLIVDALFRIDPTQDATSVIIKTSTTGSFFDNTLPADVQQISLVDGVGGFVVFGPVPGQPGHYHPVPATQSQAIGNQISTPFLTQDADLFLFVGYEGEFFVAKSSFTAAPPINSLLQGDGTLFGDDNTEVMINFTDIPDEDNFYVFDLDFNEFVTTEDTFYPGQNFEFSYFYDEEVPGGEEIEISILGADEAFYNYMNQLIEQSEQGDNGPFQTPVTTVRGNFINTTEIDNIDVFNNVDDPNNFILGYFALTQEHKQTITIE